MKKVRDPKMMKFDPAFDTGHELEVLYSRPNVEFVGAYLKGTRLLNVGCWTGGFESLVVYDASEVTGIDVEPQALEVADRLVTAATFLEASVLELPFADGSFDLVTLWDVLEHLPIGTERQALKEMARVLGTGGHLAISTPSGHWLSRALDPAYFLTAHRHYGVDELKRMLEDTGFQIVKCEVLGGWLVVADYMSLYIWKYIVRKPKPAWPRFRKAVLRNAERKGFASVYLLSEKAETRDLRKHDPGAEPWHLET